jgi:prophage regulatory protein
MKVERKQEPPIEAADMFVRGREAARITGLSRSRLYLLLKSGGFPKPIKLGDKRNSPIAFSLREIEAWQREQLAKRDRAAAA